MALPPFDPDQTKPDPADNISAFPAVEQAFRDIMESWILIEHNTAGTHKLVTLDTIAEPTIAATLVGIWQESGVLKTRYAGGTVYNLSTTATAVAKAGDTMTGLLVLSGDAVAALNPASKQQMDTADALKAPLASPTFTGIPKADTAAAGTNTTQLATTAFVQAAGNPFGSALLHVRDEKADGVAGGGFTSGAWQTRDLNTVKTNEITGASLAANQITLPTGTYYIEAAAPSKRGQNNKIKLRNTSDATDELIGLNTNSNTDDTSTGHSLATLAGRFTIAAGKVFEIQHRSQITRATDGFGQAATFGVIEVYTDVRIWKL